MPDVVVTSTELLNAIEADLERIEFFHRSAAVKGAMRKVGNMVKARIRGNVPKPGYPGDKPELKPLRDTVGVSVKEYPTGAVVAIVGFRRPAGAHGGDILEEGHVMAPHKGKAVRKRTKQPRSGGRPEHYRKVGMGGRVEGQHYIQQADESSKAEQLAIMDSAIKDALAKQEGT